MYAPDPEPFVVRESTLQERISGSIRTLWNFVGLPGLVARVRAIAMVLRIRVHWLPARCGEGGSAALVEMLGTVADPRSTVRRRCWRCSI